MRHETYLEDLHLGIRARHIEQRHGAQLLIWVPDACAVPSPHHCTLHNTTIYVGLAPPKTFTQSDTDLLYPSEHQRNYIQALELLAMRPFLSRTSSFIHLVVPSIALKNDASTQLTQPASLRSTSERCMREGTGMGKQTGWCSCLR